MSLEGDMSVRLGLPSLPLTEDQKLFDELLVLYNAVKSLGYALDSYTGAVTPPTGEWGSIGVNAARIGLISKIYITFYEDADVGNTVAFDSISTIPMARLAVQGTYPCRGFCAKDVSAGDKGEVILLGLFPEFPAASLVPGAVYYQSTTPGQIVPGPSTDQPIGYAITDTTLFFNPSLL